jgi:hypothetical protein
MTDTKALSESTPATNARFTDEGNGLIAEMMSAQTLLDFNPTTNSIRAMFTGQKYINTGTADAPRYLAIQTDINTLNVQFSDKLTQCYGVGLVDPVTGGALDGISIAGLELLFKAVYDKEFNDNAQAIAASIAAAEQAAKDAQAAADAADAEARAQGIDPTTGEPLAQ